MRNIEETITVKSWEELRYMFFPLGTYPNNKDVVVANTTPPTSFKLSKIKKPRSYNETFPVTAVASFGIHIFFVEVRNNQLLIAEHSKEDAEMTAFDYLLETKPQLFCDLSCKTFLNLPNDKVIYDSYHDLYLDGTFSVEEVE